MIFNFRHITISLLTLMLFVALGSLASCSREDEPFNSEFESEAHRVMFTISMGEAGLTRSPSDGSYDSGSGLENYINIEDDDYRCYLFNRDNILVSTLSVTNVYKIDTEASGRNYTVIATLRPFEIEAIKKGCKIAILSNWQNYVNVEAGRTTISDLCDSQESIFNFSQDKATLSEGNLIPMYGIKSFENSMPIEDDTYQVGTVRMLRAYAKVEVDVTFKDFKDASGNETKGGDITGISLTNCYNKGFKVQSSDYASEEKDYVHGTWYEDYTPVHIPTDANSFKLNFVQVDGKYVVYMPEYNNLVEDVVRDKEERSRIRIDFKLEGKDYYGYLDFRCSHSKEGVEADTGDGGEAYPADIIDVERNNWYKFNVTISPRTLTYVVDVQPYSSEYLLPDFGLERTEDGYIVVRDSNGNVIKYIRPNGAVLTFAEDNRWPYLGKFMGVFDSTKRVLIGYFDDGRSIIFNYTSDEINDNNVLENLESWEIYSKPTLKYADGKTIPEHLEETFCFIDYYYDEDYDDASLGTIIKHKFTHTVLDDKGRVIEEYLYPSLADFQHHKETGYTYSRTTLADYTGDQYGNKVITYYKDNGNGTSTKFCTLTVTGDTETYNYGPF